VLADVGRLDIRIIRAGRLRAVFVRSQQAARMMIGRRRG
jgi:hypothetical protein